MMYRQGQIFAIIVDDTLYFKVGDANRANYEAAGSSAFTYESKGKKVAMSYWRVPDEVLEDPESIVLWAGRAYAKKTNFVLVTEDNVKFIEKRLNGRPRKCLSYQTPSEVLRRLTGGALPD